jgi:hypothetical protein
MFFNKQKSEYVYEVRHIKEECEHLDIFFWCGCSSCECSSVASYRIKGKKDKIYYFCNICLPNKIKEQMLKLERRLRSYEATEVGCGKV